MQKFPSSILSRALRQIYLVPSLGSDYQGELVIIAQSGSDFSCRIRSLLVP